MVGTICGEPCAVFIDGGFVVSTREDTYVHACVMNVIIGIDCEVRECQRGGTIFCMEVAPWNAGEIFC